MALTKFELEGKTWDQPDLRVRTEAKLDESSAAVTADNAIRCSWRNESPVECKDVRARTCEASDRVNGTQRLDLISLLQRGSALTVAIC